MSFDKSETQCQPCDSFAGRWDYFGMSVHECMSPGCEGGRVAFCDNCYTDHHKNGYGSCGGTWHFPCKHNHKQCQGEEQPGIGDS